MSVLAADKPQFAASMPRIALSLSSIHGLGPKDLLLGLFAILWIAFFFSPLAAYNWRTRAPITRNERWVMIAIGMVLVLLLWLSLPGR